MDQNDRYLGKKLEGRYEIQELIGMGGMSNVYKAFDVIDQRTVSVKILRDEFLTNTEFLRRFKNESKAIAVLSHPNIVRVYDVSFTNRVHSIVMEYIDGITLKDYIERQRVLGWKEALHFTLQILRALEHAHERGIVHRDIKPQNIMLLQNGNIKVTDFGIARFARSEVKTITDRAIGSVHYISPEQAMGDNTDHRSDVYSVGVMLFEMLTGTLPFEAESAVSVAIKQIQSQAVRPTQINPDVPSGLEEIILKAMEKDTARRYQSAGAMMEDIERFKSDPSIHFQYKYLSDDNNPAVRKKYRKAIEETREDDPLHKQRSKRRRVPYLPILAGVTFAFVLASLAFVGLMIYLNNPFAQVGEVSVPSLVGLKFETAKSQYANLGVEIVQESVVNNDEFAKGVIFEQEPKAGRSIREGNTIRVKVSSGQAKVVLENFENRDVEQVKQKLEGWGLRYEIKQEYHQTVPLGYVIYTNPSKGSEVTSGATVQVYVSLGPDVVWKTVPDVKGMTVDKARQMLEYFNLRIGDVTYEQSDEPADTVIAQDPMEGTMQTEGTAINIIISKGGDFKRVAIVVDLPDFDREVTMQAFQDGVEVARDVLNPSVTANWRPFFTGLNEVSYIEIYVDGEEYRQYELDFAPSPPTFYEVTGLGRTGGDDDRR